MNIIRPSDEYLDQPFWRHLAAGNLQLNCCKACRTFRHPPGPICPKCRAFGDDWAPVSGRAQLKSFTTVHHPVHPSLADNIPYTITLVELEEGVRMVSGIPAPLNVDLHIGMDLQCQIKAIDERFALAYFLPVGREQK